MQTDRKTERQNLYIKMKTALVMSMLFDFLSICLLISACLSLFYMLIDAQLCVGPVFMKSGLEILNICKIHRRNEHESASMTMTILYVTVMLFGWVFMFLKGC